MGGPKSSASRMVPKLSHRPPVRRDTRERIRVFLSKGKRLPLVLLAAGWVAFLGFGIRYYLENTTYFFLEDLAFEGNERVETELLTQYMKTSTGVGLGASLVRIDTEHLEQSLATVPEIASAKVEKFWPNKMVISIEEREAAGIFVSDAGSFVFDESGYLFSRSTVKDWETEGLFVVTGFQGDMIWDSGKTLNPVGFETVTTYHRTFASAAPEVSRSISEFRWSPTSGLSIVLDDGGEVFCGYQDVVDAGPIVESLFRERLYGRVLQVAHLVTTEHLAVDWKPNPMSQFAQQN